MFTLKLKRKLKANKIYKKLRRIVINSNIYKFAMNNINKRSRRRIYERYKDKKMTIDLRCDPLGCDLNTMLIKRESKITIIPGGKGFCFSARNGKFNVQGKLTLGCFVVIDVKLSNPVLFSRHALLRSKQRFGLNKEGIQSKASEAFRSQNGEYRGIHERYKKPVYLYYYGKINFVCVKSNSSIGVLTVY